MRRTNSQIRDEYIRLASCWAYAREYTIAEFKSQPSSNNFPLSGTYDIEETLPTKDELIIIFDTGKFNNKVLERKKFTSSQMLSGLKQGLMDTVFEINEALEYGSTIASSFLMRYQAETGRHFYTDAGDPNQIIKKILSKGHIKNDDEFYVLKEILSDLEQTIIPHKDTPRAEKILGTYEFGNRK